MQGKKFEKREKSKTFEKEGKSKLQGTLVKQIVATIPIIKVLSCVSLSIQ